MEETEETTQLIIVETHADDAYLSLHEHLLRWKKGGGFSIMILTVQSAVREKEARAYAEAIGVGWAGLGWEDGQLPESIDFSLVPGYDPASSLVVSPFGIQHPDHLAVRRLLRPALLYLDIPYYTKLKNQDELNQALSGQPFYSIYLPHHGKRDKKFWGCFKSQAKFFFYNDLRELARIPEICIVAPDGASPAE